MKSAERFVRQARAELKRKASPAYARRMQMFFKSPVPAFGWRTHQVRKLAQRLQRDISRAGDNQLLLAVAEKLFAGPTIEEKPWAWCCSSAPCAGSARRSSAAWSGGCPG